MAVENYSRVPASNNSAPPNGAPEGWAPGSMNNTLRQIMTDIVQEAAKGKCRVLGTVAGTNTITATLSPSLDGYSAGMMVVLTPANSVTGAVTLNINGLGGLDVFKGNGSALVTGDMVAGVPYILVLDSGADDWIVLNPTPITAAQLLALLLTVDGSGSGLDADLLDGLSSAAFALASHTHANGDLTGYTAADVLAKLLTVDGSGSGLDADLLDGSSSAAFAAASHGHAAADITSGTIANARLPNIGSMPGVTIQSDPGGTPSGTAGQMFFYY